MAQVVRISKTLSLWLRHRPQAGGLSLDAEGWAEVDAVLAALARRGLPGDLDTLLNVVETNDKQRFELSPDLARIRARQGHSLAGVTIAHETRTPPAQLYHGTVERFLAAIMAQGLSKMRRQHVHLSADVETARRVGARRGAPVILAIDAAAMAREGVVFQISSNGVWLVEHVAPRFLTRFE
ncbi:MAG: RNA 2'-phosphotransferase [Hydrogenophilaceae bacterium]|jgi:putative RNA 2'-phosphotransferase|nr:RNA 2'-phosphotransferase [Hydrogenophilaceae bacterium]